MQLSIPHIDRLCPEAEVYQTLLPLDDSDIVELGCGRAEITRAIASAGQNRRITALEVDEIQYAQHLLIDDLPQVRFIKAGAEAIPLEDASADIVLMFKSLHHVPTTLMDEALKEVARVLRPGGYAYISEPIFAGDFNDILKMFHDEQQVRMAAFEAVKRAVDSGLMQLDGQHFFQVPMHFDDFADYEQKILKVTHSDHQLSPALYAAVKDRFETHMTADGANFQMPIRVDLLRKANEI